MLSLVSLTLIMANIQIEVPTESVARNKRKLDVFKDDTLLSNTDEPSTKQQHTNESSTPFKDLLDPIIINNEPHCRCLNGTLPMKRKECKKAGSKWNGRIIFICQGSSECKTRPILADDVDELAVKSLDHNPEPVCAKCEKPLDFSEVKRLRKKFEQLELKAEDIERRIALKIREMSCSRKGNGYTCCFCKSNLAN